MATKKELIAQAHALGLAATTRQTAAQIQDMIDTEMEALRLSEEIQSQAAAARAAAAAQDARTQAALESVESADSGTAQKRPRDTAAEPFMFIGVLLGGIFE